jgi:hypothetical protein
LAAVLATTTLLPAAPVRILLLLARSVLAALLAAALTLTVLVTLVLATLLATLVLLLVAILVHGNLQCLPWR